jgi:hypothetical protein
MQTPYELNHLYKVQASNDEIAIGQNTVITYQPMELFEKSLALTSDLRRVPILRGSHLTGWLDRLIKSSIVASGLNLVTFTIEVYSGYSDGVTSDIGGLEDLLLHKQMVVFYNNTATTFFIHVEEAPWDYEGGMLLSDYVTLVLTTATDANVAGTAFPANMLYAHMFLEIDWFPINKNEFKNFILESVYADKLSSV